MKLALLSGANPRVCSIVGPKVRLHEGDWTIRCVGLVDSELALHNSRHEVVLEMNSENPVCGIPGGNCSVVINFRSRGTEPHISVFAELRENGT